jgi:hypothetical protein
MTDDATRLSRCGTCGAELPIDSAGGLCPACLMAAALSQAASAGSGDEATALSGGESAGAPAGVASRLTPGQAFGPYRIGRLLGRGGMGEVYEAEHLEHGRRVALKVLNQRLAGADDRERFLREGQLAASISHPNTVYIFGSEEIAGAPAISMELVAGGTLKDRLEREGPLPAAVAVDAILDVIAGLDAAQAGGILHRDIKPSNCFVDPDGRVKVGDFGLSISTLARDVDQRAEFTGFQGTPQFAAPEQLNGQPLDVRADIYAVGATLFYLLTKQPPFDDRDLMTLVNRVTNEPPPSPRAHQPRVPPGLAALVLRCLAKDRAARPATHAELADALRPFSSKAPTPATLGLRLAAGVTDWLLLAALTAPFAFAPAAGLTLPATVNLELSYVSAGSRNAAVAAVLACALTLAYYDLLEGLGAASLGKRICGLQVSRCGGARAGLTRALARTAVFMLPVWLTLLGPFVSRLATGWPLAERAVLNGGWILFATLSLGVLFATARRRNGFAGLHDLLSDTRVVMRRASDSRAPLDIPRRVPQIVAGARRVGPFDLTSALGPTHIGELHEGFDPALRRRVWLHMLPPETPAVAPGLRDLARPGRLRWLMGRRWPGEAWDAYEAPDGAPFVTLLETPRPWSVVKRWIDDLSHELQSADADGTMPVLAIERVWVTRSSQARLIDFQLPGLEVYGAPAGSAQRFLADVAARSLDARPLPLSAKVSLDRLAGSGFGSLREAAAATSLLAAGSDRVTRWRRATALALTNVPVLITLLAVLAALPIATRLLRLDFLRPFTCLIQISKLESETSEQAATTRRDLEVYASAAFGDAYRDAAFWDDRRTRALVGPLRPLALRALANHPAVTPQETAAAAAGSRALLDEPGLMKARQMGLGLLFALPAAALLASAAVALVSALMARGLLLRLLGLAIVTRRGAEISRSMALLRALVGWLPVLAVWMYAAVSLRTVGFPEAFASYQVVAPLLACAAAGAIAAVVRPQQAWQDRVLRTFIVPR